METFWRAFGTSREQLFGEPLGQAESSFGSSDLERQENKDKPW
jgi:hypothetical protein